MGNSESVSFQKLKLNRLAYEKIIPPEIERNIGKAKRITYGALDGSENVGIAVFTIPETSFSAVQLHYVDVKEEYRGQGIGKKLLDFSSADLKETGGRFLLYRNVSEDPGELLKYFNISLYLGFQPVTKSESLYVYDRSSIRRSAVMRELKMRGKVVEVTTLPGYNSPLLSSFNSKGEFGFLELNENTFDTEYSSFFVDDSCISAGIIGKLFNGELLILRDIVADKFSGVRKKILPALLIESLDAGIRVKSIKKFLITLSGTLDKRAIEKLFEEPEAIYRAIDMVRYL